MTWRPLFEANAARNDCLRRVIMAGYRRRGSEPHVGEAFYGDPDERGSRWIWADGGDVMEPQAFQDLPDFPIADQNDKYVCGGPTRMVETERV